VAANVIAAVVLRHVTADKDGKKRNHLYLL